MDQADYTAHHDFFTTAAASPFDSHDRNPHAFAPIPSYLAPPAWPITSSVLDDQEELHAAFDMPLPRHPVNPYASTPRRHNSPNTAPVAFQHTSALGLGMAQNLAAPTGLMHPPWQFALPQTAPQNYALDSLSDSSYDDCSFTPPSISSLPLVARSLQLPMHVSSAPDAMGNYLAMSGPMENMGTLAGTLNEYGSAMMAFPVAMPDMLNRPVRDPATYTNRNAGGSPSSSTFEVSSLSSSDCGWTSINFGQCQNPFGAVAAAAAAAAPSNTRAVFNPSETLHIRTDSNSSNDDSRSDDISQNYEDMPFPLHSPISEHSAFDAGRHGVPRLITDYHSCSDHDHSAVQSPDGSSPIVSPTSVASRPITGARSRPMSSYSSSASPTGASPPLRRRRSPTAATPLAKTTKSAIKKADPATLALVRKSAGGNGGEKRVGRRRGPLLPKQRQSASEIRKLRACLRCKFLKKTCDKGDPCAGCQPSHARLWQVPCTRIDIKDIGYFIDDWECDFKRHVTLGVSVNNIKGFSQRERTVYITHGFGYFLPIAAREVYVSDDKCFEADWIETSTMTQYYTNTSKLTTGIAGVSADKLNEYLDSHLDNGFVEFVEGYFQGTPFLTQILLTAYSYYEKTKTPVIRKALKLVLAYNLTVHITLVEGMSEEEQNVGRIEDQGSRFVGKTVAPVMINFQVKCALSKMWRELQKDVLGDLSGLYSSVYQGDKLRHWPTIFMVATVLLAVWELMQFDCHYREPDEAKVDKFCKDMEATPVGVIVGLFQAISQKLPSFMEWDTTQHAGALNNDQPICDALTEVRRHIEEHESYLRDRPAARFARNDFDSLSSKFLSKLVIRAN